MTKRSNSPHTLDVDADAILRCVSFPEDYELLKSHPPRWLIKGIFEWCTNEGVVATREAEHHNVQGLPLLIPGTRYAITLSDTKWDLLKIGVSLLVNISLANAANWLAGSVSAVSMTVITVLQRLVHTSDEERLVLKYIACLKRDLYSGTDEWPTVEDLCGVCNLLDLKKLQQTIDILAVKKLISKKGSQLEIVL